MPDYWQRQWKEIFLFCFCCCCCGGSRSVLRPSYVYSVVTSGTELKDFQVFVECAHTHPHTHTHTHTHTHSSLLPHAELQGQMDSKLKGNWSSSSYQLCGDYFVCVRNASLLLGHFEFLKMSVMFYTICVREKKNTSHCRHFSYFTTYSCRTLLLVNYQGVWHPPAPQNYLIN